MRYRVQTALVAGFGLVTGLFFLAAGVTVWSVDRLLALEQRVAHLDHAKHQGHLTLPDIQQTYIRQNQTMALGDPSHLDDYSESRRALSQRFANLEVACEMIGAAGAAASIEEIRATADAMDQYFRNEVVPRLGAGGNGHDIERHGRLDDLMAQARTQVVGLNAKLEKESALARDEHNRLLGRTRVATLVMLMLSLVAALGIGLAITRTIDRPIRRLQAAFEQIRAGALETQVVPDGPLELRALGVGFNEMSDALVEMKRQIAHSERMAVMGEIAAGVAHELNNPLGVITGYLKLLRKTTEGEQAAGDLDIIAQEIQHCREIVEGLLEVARPVQLDMQPVDAAAIVRDAVERLETAIDQPGPTFHLDCPDKPLRLLADESALRRVLNNLLANALDAAGEKGRVAATAQESGDWIVLSVSDSGPGVPPEIADSLFEAFKTTKAKGTGLGLAISLSIVKAHGGTMEWDTGPMGGARFRVLLPASQGELK